MNRHAILENPYRPGAGQIPPFLAGRVIEQDHFKRVLYQRAPSENFLITGLRGFGKTVLLERMHQIAIEHRWLWVGNDLSESSSLSEERLALRVMTDLAHTITQAVAQRDSGTGDGAPATAAPMTADDFGNDLRTFDALKGVYECSPGLPSDRLKAVLNRAGSLVARTRAAGIVLAYDEAQCLTDHAERNEYPMSMLIETVGALQKREAIVPIILVLSGLPHVQDALTETRTYTERMFHVMHLDRLSRDESWAALTNPIAQLMPPLHAPKDLLGKVVDLSGGYPYLIQFFGKELVQKLLENGGTLAASAFPASDTLDRLDAGLFGARWNKTTDKQREILGLLANRVAVASPEFSAQEVVALSPNTGEMSNAQASQLLQGLCDRGLIYRTRHGRYAFTVPMSESMIIRRLKSETEVADSWHRSTTGTAAATGPQKSKGWKWFR